MDNQSAASAIPFLSENAAKRSLSFRQVTRNNFLISSDAYLRAQKVKDTFVTIVGGKIIRFARTVGTDPTESASLLALSCGAMRQIVTQDFLSRLPLLWRNSASPSSNWYTVSVRT